MIKDPVVEEVRRIRDQMASEYDYDIRRIAKASREREKTCGHKVVDLSKKKKTG